MNRYELPLPLPRDGINLIDDSLIADTEAAEGTVNISFKDGIPQSRKGYVKAHTGEVAPNSMFNYIKDGVRYLLAACGNTLKKLGGDTFTNITGTLNSDKIECLTYPFKFADPDTFGDKCFILDGNSYRYYDGGADIKNVTPYAPSTDEQTAYGQNVLSTAPDEVNKQKYILNDNERVWVAGYGKLVRISHLQKPDYFPSNQVWKLTENCTGMAKFMDEVLLFTENTVTLISGNTPNWELPDKYVLNRLPGGYGCNAHRSIAEGSNAIYWANKDGVYRYRYLPSGFSIPECISEFQLTNGKTRSVKKLLKSITDWSLVHAQFYDNEYRLYIGNKKVMVFDAINSTWALYEYDKTFNCSYIYNKELYYAKDYAYKMDVTYNPSGTSKDGLNDNGTAINFVLKSKFFDFNQAANKKKFKKMYITLYSELVSYNVDLVTNMDNEINSINGEIVNVVARWGEMKFGENLNVRETNLNFPVRVSHKGKKYNIQYELKTSNLNNAFTLLSAVLIFKVKELK